MTRLWKVVKQAKLDVAAPMSACRLPTNPLILTGPVKSRIAVQLFPTGSRRGGRANDGSTRFLMLGRQMTDGERGTTSESEGWEAATAGAED